MKRLSRYDGTAGDALCRLFWVTGYDRCKTKDSRIIWFKEIAK